MRCSRLHLIGNPSLSITKAILLPDQTEAGFPATVTHAAGETKLEKQPEKIVVLDMAALDTIDAIGAGDKVVGTVTSSLPNWLKDNQGKDYSKVANVGSLKEPDTEAIAKLNPDLVVVASRTASFYEEFSKVWPTVDVTASWKNGKYLEEIDNQIKLLGTVTGHTNQAEEAIKKINSAVKKYQGTAKGKGKAAVVMVNGGELSLHGSKSRWEPIYSVFGFDKIAEAEQQGDEGHKAQKISYETLSEINPDWIFVVDRDAAIGKADATKDNAKQALNNDLVKQTNAGKNNRIVYLDSQRWYIIMTGATNFPAELDEVARAL